VRELIPQAWAEQIAGYEPDGGPSGPDWLRGVPGLIEASLERWRLTVTGPAMTGWTAMVLPVSRDGAPLALKIGWPHHQAEHEALALRLWDGAGAVRLVAARPREATLLLERLDADRDLDRAEVWTDEACEIIGTLLVRLNVAAPPQLQPLAEFLDPHLEQLGQDPRVPRRVATRVRSLAAELFADAGEPRMLHTDLHFENVLAGEREPWLAIDPKPLAGHPAWEIQPVLRNRFEELGTGAALRWSVRHRLQLMAETMGIDIELARAWTLVNTGIEVLWCADDPEDASRQMAIFKALDD